MGISFVHWFIVLFGIGGLGFLPLPMLLALFVGFV
jgi:hypothetical protein